MKRPATYFTIASALIFIGAFFLLTPGQVLSDPAAAPVDSATPAIPTVLLPSGTPVQLIISQDLQSGKSKYGDVVSYQVLKPVIVAGQTLIPAGATAFGQVTESKKPGMFGVPGKLSFTCEYIKVPGAQIPLQSNVESRSGASDTQTMVDNQVKSEAMGAVMSGGIPMVNPEAVLGFMHGGGSVVVHRGQQLTMYVASDTRIIAPPQPAPNRPNVITLIVNGQTLFILKDGEQITGKLLGFDGTNFQIATSTGTRTVASGDVEMAKAL